MKKPYKWVISKQTAQYKKVSKVLEQFAKEDIQMVIDDNTEANQGLTTSRGVQHHWLSEIHTLKPKWNAIMCPQHV